MLTIQPYILLEEEILDSQWFYSEACGRFNAVTWPPSVSWVQGMVAAVWTAAKAGIICLLAVTMLHRFLAADRVTDSKVSPNP